MRSTIILRAASILLLANVATATNGSGYGGGESPTLKTAITYLRLALHRIRLGDDTDIIGQSEGCAKLKEPSICRVVEGLNESQRQVIKEFLVTHHKDLLKALERMEIEFTKEPISVTGPDGKSIAVAARTKLGPTGPVTFHEGSTASLSPYGFVALLCHELGHKITVSFSKSGALEDNESVEKFGAGGGGRVFLDALGASLALYLARVEQHVPVVRLDRCYPDSVSVLLNDTKSFGQGPSRELSAVSPGSREPTIAISDFLSAIHSRDFTLAAWILYEGKPNEQSKPQLILSNINYDHPSPSGLEMARMKNGRLGIVVGEKLIETKVMIAPGKYHHIALRRQGDTFSIFYDGKLVATEVVKLPKLAAVTNAYFGRSAHPVDGLWEGNIALAFAFEKAMTDKEVLGQFQCAGNR